MDDGTTITESVAICRYLESLYPEPNLFGRDPKEAAIIEMWMRRGELLVAHPMMLGVRHTHPALAALETQNPAIAEYNKAAATRAMKVLDRQLADNEWLAAGRLIKLRPPEELTHVGRWHAAMSARPAAKAAM